jgi:hypothetical protein
MDAAEQAECLILGLSSFLQKRLIIVKTTLSLVNTFVAPA